jgi:RNA polymerase sigma-70 factor (ECF subfamily)
MVNEPSDETLMAAYVAGDAPAFQRLFARLGPRIHGFFMRAFRDEAVADDLLQTTFMKLHRARSEWIAGSAVRPWLFTIAARVRLDEIRRRYRLKAQATLDDIDAVESPVGAVDEEAGERASRVRAALDKLPESQRLIVQLHRYEGLTFGEIANAIGSTEGAVKLRAFRAYERLRVELRDLADDAANEDDRTDRAPHAAASERSPS